MKGQATSSSRDLKWVTVWWFQTGIVHFPEIISGMSSSFPLTSRPSDFSRWAQPAPPGATVIPRGNPMAGRGHAPTEDSGPKNSVVEYVFQPDHYLLEVPCCGWRTGP